ncbi:MAG: GDP-mannose 4,6-dehydratase [Alphaproteobacteria bacterium]|nr:GDP-mannose 4,6-dehydratase [Alphaproteobacteria bacterium]
MPAAIRPAAALEDLQEMGSTILITGGAGFIGSNFVHHIAERYPDYRIVVVDALTYAGSVESLPQKFLSGNDPDRKFWYGNVCNAELLATLVADADYVVHFAAETHVTRSIFDNQLFFITDVIGTHTVANAVLKARRRIRRFVHVSTSEVYGTARDGIMTEEHALNPMSPYASAKCGADRLVYSYWATYRIPAVIVRPFNNYGPRQHLEKVVPRFITSAILSEPLFVHGNGKAARDFIHVDDTCRAIDMLLHAPAERVEGEVFNVASGQDRAILDIAGDVCRLMKAPETSIQFRGERPGQVFRHTGDASKIKRVLGWEARVPWSDGLSATAEWYARNRAWWEKQLWMRTIPITTAEGKTELH